MDKSNNHIKESLYNQCISFINNRNATVQNTINEIQESLLSETKSSAGDKHETGRAMLQLEREKAGNQLAEIQKVKLVLSKIDITQSHQAIGLGSLVYTSQANYFISISAGKLEIDSKQFFAISQNTPIAKLLLSKAVGDKLNFRNQEFKIIKIV